MQQKPEESHRRAKIAVAVAVAVGLFAVFVVALVVLLNFQP